MDTFAFIIHPIDPKRDVSRKYPLLGRVLTEKQIDFFSTFFPPVYLSEITGITSAESGKEIKGWFLACPYTPKRMLELPEEQVYRKIIQTGRKAEQLGAKMLGLGAFTSVVGDSGVTISDRLEMPVTTGDSYTVAVAIQALRRAAGMMGIEINSAVAAVVGATGAIGKISAELLAEEVAELYLIGLRKDALEELRESIQGTARARCYTSTGMDVLPRAQLVLTVTSAVHAVIDPQQLQVGSVICDVARPRDVSALVAAARDDVLVIDGGMVDVPGPVKFNFDFGLPPGKAYACMAETFTLALEGRFEDYTIGKDLHRAQVKEIEHLAEKHGFKLSGFRSFEQEVTMEKIDHVRERAKKAQRRN